ncbi:MAG: outer membrane beta-barrel protein [Gemmatimonadota bacterium]|nr:MAG: outer membrane beta-barrel protein [Gemmatimonadota bacterium]
MKSKLCLATLLLVALAVPAQAQSPWKLGIGISLNQLFADLDEESTFAIPINNLHFPVAFGQRLLLEPEVGFTTGKQTVKVLGVEQEFKATVWRLGIGVFYRFPATEDLRVYLGPRFKWIRTTAFEDDGTERTEFAETDISIGAAAGGEYFFSSHFSLGGEAQFNYIDLGEPDVEIGDIVDLRRKIFTTDTAVLIRWYF